MSKTSDRSEQGPASGEKVPGWTPEVGTRLALIIERFGGLKPAAEFLDTKAETIASWRDGKTRAPLFSVQALAEKTGFTLDWLMKGEESPSEGRDIPPSTSEMDDEFFGVVAEMVELAYRDAGSRPTARELGQTSARIYAKVVAAGANPVERMGALKALINEERDDLRAAATKPGSRKSTA